MNAIPFLSYEDARPRARLQRGDAHSTWRYVPKLQKGAPEVVMVGAKTKQWSCEGSDRD